MNADGKTGLFYLFLFTKCGSLATIGQLRSRESNLVDQLVICVSARAAVTIHRNREADLSARSNS